MNQLIKDIRIYQLMNNNKNYYDRLFEAYNYLKSVGVNTLEDFKSRDDLKVGAFTYDEMSIFDRLSDEKYASELSSACNEIFLGLQDYINNPNIGDQLASWGTLGETPYREELIASGNIIYGLTEEEAARHIR